VIGERVAGVNGIHIGDDVFRRKHRNGKKNKIVWGSKPLKGTISDLRKR
jgi:hypothetical protein